MQNLFPPYDKRPVFNGVFSSVIGSVYAAPKVTFNGRSIWLMKSMIENELVRVNTTEDEYVDWAREEELEWIAQTVDDKFPQRLKVSYDSGRDLHRSWRNHGRKSRHREVIRRERLNRHHRPMMLPVNDLDPDVDFGLDDDF